MNCQKCGTELNQEQRFCSKCGEHQHPEHKKDYCLCQKCGKKILLSDKYCGFCGLKQDNMEVIHGDTDYIKDAISSNNMKNFKVRRLTEEDKKFINREKAKSYRKTNYLKQKYGGQRLNDYWKIIGAIAALIIIVSSGIYFLNTVLFNDDAEVMGPNDNEIINSDNTGGEDSFIEAGNSEENLSQEETLKKLLIDFNDAWIGYVNNDETKIFQYIIPGSEVEGNILKFNKEGVTEEFLQIQVKTVEVIGNQGFMKVHEEIEKITNGKREIMVYDWIYEAQKKDGVWLIKNYTKDNNPDG